MERRLDLTKSTFQQQSCTVDDAHDGSGGASTVGRNYDRCTLTQLDEQTWITEIQRDPQPAAHQRTQRLCVVDKGVGRCAMRGAGNLDVAGASDDRIGEMTDRLVPPGIGYESQEGNNLPRFCDSSGVHHQSTEMLNGLLDHTQPPSAQGTEK